MCLDNPRPGIHHLKVWAYERPASVRSFQWDVPLLSTLQRSGDLALQGVTMVRRIFVISLLMIAIFDWSSCGGSSSSSSSPAAPNPAIAGTLYTFVGDTPVCDVLSLRMNATALTLGVASSTATVSVLSPLNTVINLNFAALRDFSTVLALSTTTAATYDRVSMQLQAPTLIVYDATQNPPFRAVTATLTTGTNTPLFNINPPLTISQNKVSALNLDFDLEQMVGINSAGEFDGNITPAAIATALTASATGGFRELDGLEGFVRTVQTSSFTSGSTTFTGGILLQMLSSSVSGSGGPGVTISFTKDTQICMPPTVSNQACQPPALIAEILTNSYASVDAFLDSNGNMSATSVDFEDVEDPVNKKIAFVGPILSLTKDITGNVTGFTMFLRDQQPPSNFNVANDTAVAVNLSPATIYQSSSRATNFASLPFGSSALAVGQEVVVHGTFTVPTTTPPSAVVAADTIYLKLQTHEGNLASLLAVQPDDHTGAFTLFPCATILQQGDAAALPIYVFTDSTTAFVNTSGLTTLRSQPAILVKGLLFLEPQSVTINGVTVPAGKLVMLAKKVTQLS